MGRGRDERARIIVPTLSHFILHLSELSFPAVASVVSYELLGVEKAYERIGFAYFVFSFFFGVMQILGGYLSDRLGARGTIWIYLVGTGLSLIGVSYSGSFNQLIIFLGAEGAFLGIYHPGGMSLVSRGTTQHGFSMGIHGMGGNFGLALSPFVASALAGIFGWRRGFLLLGLLPIIFSGWVLLDKRLSFKEKPLDGIKENPQSRGFLVLPIAILFLMSGFNGMCYRGFTTFLPAYFNEKLSQNMVPGFSSILQTGTFTSLVLILGMAGQFLGGRLADRYSKEKLFTAVFFLSVPFMLLVGFLSGGLVIISAMLFSFFYFSNQPIVNSLLPRYSDEKFIGRVYGLFFFMNFGVGAFMSWISGEVGQRLALNYIFIILAGLLFMIGLFGLFLIRLGHGTGRECSTGLISEKEKEEKREL